MKNIRLALTFIILISINASAFSQYWDTGKIDRDFKWSFRMSQGEDSLGYSIIEIKKVGDQLLISEDAAVPGFSEDLFAYVDSKTLRPDSTIIVGRLSGFPVECKVKLTGNSVTGYSNFPKHPSKPTININIDLNEGVIFRAQSFFLSPFYKDLVVGKEFEYEQFNTMDGLVRNIKVKVTKAETVVLEGKGYEALKLEFSGGVAEQNVFIDKNSPRILKISFRDTPWIYELIESKSY